MATIVLPNVMRFISLMFNHTNITRIFPMAKISMYIHSVLNPKSTNHLELLTCLALTLLSFTLHQELLGTCGCSRLITMFFVSYLVWVVLLILTRLTKIVYFF